MRKSRRHTGGLHKNIILILIKAIKALKQGLKRLIKPMRCFRTSKNVVSMINLEMLRSTEAPVDLTDSKGLISVLFPVGMADFQIYSKLFLEEIWVGGDLVVEHERQV